MIKFFRRLRQSLVPKNKIGNYTLYAFGEIVLVMIGILLALQVNNWNNDRQRAKQERGLLIQLHSDLWSMKGDIEGDLSILKQGIKSHFKILEYLQTDAPYDKTLCFDFYWLSQDEYVYPVSTAYETVKSKGLDIIRNDSIRNHLQNGYDLVFPRISKQSPFYPDIEVFFSPFYQEHFSPNEDSSLTFTLEINEDLKVTYPYKRQLGEIEELFTIGYVPIDYQSLKESPNFKMLMKQALKYRVYKVSRYLSALEIVEDLMQIIKKELKNKFNYTQIGSIN